MVLIQSFIVIVTVFSLLWLLQRVLVQALLLLSAGWYYLTNPRVRKKVNAFWSN